MGSKSKLLYFIDKSELPEADLFPSQVVLMSSWTAVQRA
jgi:hypothetical protein